MLLAPSLVVLGAMIPFIGEMAASGAFDPEKGNEQTPGHQGARHASQLLRTEHGSGGRPLRAPQPPQSRRQREPRPGQSADAQGRQVEGPFVTAEVAPREQRWQR